MQLVSLFLGIGGFELAAQWAGWDNVVSCEINDFGHRVLSYYWPDAYHHRDIKDLNRETIEKNSRWDASKPTIVVGGFPCQPFSMAGKRKGTEDDRHLWPEMLRIIREIKPDWVVGENVFGLINWDGGVVFEQVQADLEAEGYEVQPYVLPAVSVNAPHRRDRVWFVAHCKSEGWSERNRQGTNIQGREVDELRQERNGIRINLRTGNKAGCNASQNPVSDGCLQRELDEERPEIRQQRNTCTGDSKRVCGESDAGVAADTEETKCKSTSRTRTGRNGLADVCSEKYVADTSDKQLQGCEFNVGFGTTWKIEGKSGQFSRSVRSKWDQFPTQPPVCGRNDGIPSRLAGITVSKHRNESIKAYGNAVLPQVVFQIFKTINEYEKLTKTSNNGTD